MIPTWAVLGASDFWVDMVSAGIGLSSSRKKVVRASHKQIVKPKSKDDSVYRWIVDKVSLCIHRYEHDAFVAACMASWDSEDAYVQHREEMLRVCTALKEHCGFGSVFFAAERFASRDVFDLEDLALMEDMKALKESRWFIMVYPENVVSSVLFEAGLAMAMGKPSIYFVRRDVELPFLMAKAAQASIDTNVRIYPYDTIDNVCDYVEKHGRQLFATKNMFAPA